MGLFEPRTCCCCVDLKTGSLVLGVLAIIGSGMTLLSVIHETITYDDYNFLHKIIESDESCNTTTASFDCHAFLQLVDKLYTPMLITGIIYCILQLVIGSLLVHGVRKEKPQLLLPFLWWKTVELMAFMILFVCIPGMYYPPAVVIVFLVAGIISCILPVYFLLVIRGAYLQLAREQGQRHSQLKEIHNGDNYLIAA